MPAAPLEPAVLLPPLPLLPDMPLFPALPELRTAVLDMLSSQGVNTSDAARCKICGA
jgi:hypothetical protein